MKQILDNLLSLGRRRLMILGGVGLAGVLALLVGLNLVTQPDYGVLYSQLSPASAASMVDALDKAGITTKVSDDGSSVSVPKADIARARMALAEKGMPSDGEPGWELFDNTSGLGMNTFMQHINRLRAMEGELSRSIQTLDGVQSARVHLVLPEREAFSSETPDPSASVIVRAATGHTISHRQAVAIRNLISAAVPDLSPGRVTVLSARGDTILAEDGDGDGSASITGARASIEDRMEHNIEQMLSARVGAGNVRAQVSVDLDTTRQVVTQQSFNPDQQVVRSTSSRDEKAQNSQNNGQVGVTANLPPALAGPGTSNGSTDASTKTNENVTYEIGNTRSQTTTEPGAVKRISVAVLVNGIYDVGKSGQVDYQPRSPEEIKRLTDLVKSAVGYDQARGDTVSVDSLRFMDYSMDVGEPVGPTVMQRLSNNIIPILRWIVGLAIVALTLFFGVRPVVAKVLDAPQPLPPAPRAEALAGPEREEGPAPGQAPVSTPAGATVAPVARTIPPRGGVQKLQPYSAEAEAEADNFINQLAGQGSGLKRRVEVVRRLVDEDPNEAMKVLRGWLATEAEAR